MSVFDRAWYAAKEKGANHLELFQLTNSECEIKAFQQEIRAINKAITYGVGIRVIVENKVGYAFTTNIDEIELTARKAAAGAIESSADENNILPSPGKTAPLDLFRNELATESLKSKQLLLLKAEESALLHDERIKPADAAYNENIYEISIKNSFGLDESYKSSRCSLFLRVVAEKNGDSQSSYGFTYGRQLAELESPDKLGKDTAGKTISLLGGKKISSRVAPVIFDPMVGSQLVGLLSSAVSAGAIQKKKSFLVDKLNEKISNDNFNLIDDGLLENGYGSSPCDDEGVPCKRTIVVEKGILKSYLHNSYTAKKEGVESTGNASRFSFKSAPGIGPSNFFIQPTNVSKEEIINAAGEAFFVMDVSGLHSGANPITGEFSVGAVGHWLKGGVVQHAVREVTISGNLFDILNSIEKIGSDLQFFPFMGSCGSPTLLIKEMVISGS